MKIVPLWFAILVTIILFFLALDLNTEGLWTAFGLNFVFVIIGIIYAFVSNPPVSNNSLKKACDQTLEHEDLDKDYSNGLLLLKYAETQADIDKAFQLLYYCALEGHEPSKNILERMKRELNFPRTVGSMINDMLINPDSVSEQEKEKINFQMSRLKEISHSMQEHLREECLNRILACEKIEDVGKIIDEYEKNS